MLTNPPDPCGYPVRVEDDQPNPRPTTPRAVSWAEAPRAVLAGITAGPAPTVVCIAGAVGSGKSTLARRVAELADAVLIGTDDYLPDYHRVPEHLRDEPDSAHLPELAGHLADLIEGRPADVPVWCFREHRRTGVRRVAPRRLIIVEGIHALHDALGPARGLGVLVEAPASVRWARWERLESTGQRGWGVERALDFFTNVAGPTFARYEPLYRARADLTVVNDAADPGAGCQGATTAP